MARKKTASPFLQQRNDRLVDIVRAFECLATIAMAIRMRIWAENGTRQAARGMYSQAAT